MTDFAQIFFPTVRKSVPALGNPAYVDDIRAANQLMIDGLSALLGLYNSGTGFQIISGLVYDSVNNVYGPGVIWLNGQFYQIAASFAAGLYLVGGTADVMNKPFSDTNQRPIYTNYVAATTSQQTSASSPVFNGSMDSYRTSITDLVADMVAVQAITSQLGDAAFLNIGTGPNTVMAGNDPRAPFTAAQLEALFALQTSVILKGAGTAYTPVATTDPVNVGYVQANFVQKLASGNVNVGDIPSGGTQVGIAFGVTLANTNYIVLITCISQGTPFDDATSHWPAIFGKTTAGCTVRLQEGVGVTQNISIDWIVLAK